MRWKYILFNLGMDSREEITVLYNIPLWKMTSTGSYFPIKFNGDNIQHKLLFLIATTGIRSTSSLARLIQKERVMEDNFIQCGIQKYIKGF